MKGTWQTTDSGGSGVGTAVGVVLAAIVVASVAGPVVAAAVELVRMVFIAVAAVLGLAALGGIALVAVRLRQRRANRIPQVSFRGAVPPRTVRALPELRPDVAALPAPERPAEVHLHFHGVTAEDLAAILIERGLPPIPPGIADDRRQP